MKRRYESWAGNAHPDWLKVVFGEGEELEINSIWPIVDNETCGVIDGFPRPSQFFCVAFDPTSQAYICKVLNDVKEPVDANQCCLDG